MKVETILATKETENIIKNIYPLYLHDLAEIYGDLPNEYGIFEEEPLKTLAEQYDVQNIWFEKPENLYPFIIMVDGKPAGFDLISTKLFTPKSADYYLYDFFLLSPYRGKGIAEEAAKQVFDRFKGLWELYTGHKNNDRGQGFWRKTLSNYTDGNYEETSGETFLEDGIKTIFRFNNSEIKRMLTLENYEHRV